MTANKKTVLEKMIENFSKPTKHPEETERLGRKIWRFVLNFRIEQLGHSKSSSQIKKAIIDETTKAALEWDTDDPALSCEQKIMNRLAAGKYLSAVAFADASIKNKELLTKAVSRERGQIGGNAKNEVTNIAKKAALKYCKENTHLFSYKGGKKAASYKLEEKFPPIKASTYLKLLKKY